MFLLRDPGPCPVDDSPHTTCCAPGPIVTVLMPARDGVEPPRVGPVPVVRPIAAEQVQPDPITFTTSTYRSSGAMDRWRRVTRKAP